MASHSFMEQFLASPGLCHIVKNISRNFGVKDLAKCRLVSQAWKDIVDNDRNWLIFQLEHMNNKKRRVNGVKSTISRRCPGWQKVVEEFTTNQSLPKLKEFVRHMWTYFNKEKALFNPFHDAIKESNIEFVNLLEDCSIDLNFKGEENGTTPMYLACRHGNLELVKLIITLFPTYEANLKTYGELGAFTIFHLAAQNSDSQVLMLLFDTFKFEDIEDEDGWTMFHHAVECGSLETLQFLIASQQKIGFNAEETTRYSETIFHLAAHNQDPQVLKTILNTFLFEDKKDLDGWTMIHHAVQMGSNETLQFLLDLQQELGFNLEERTDGGRTILHIACWCRDFEIVDLVIEALTKAGSDIDLGTQDDEFKYTPLQFASQNSRCSNVAIKLLEKFPQRIYDLGNYGQHILHFACKDGNLEVGTNQVHIWEPSLWY